MSRAHEDPELLRLARRYVVPGRRYLKLGGGLLRLEGADRDRFARALGADAASVTAPELAVLLEGGWRERRTAAWLIAVSRRTAFRERLGDLLLAGEVCCTGLAYGVALASFGTPRDAELLSAHLDRYLRRPDLLHDQPVVMGALLSVDHDLGTDRAARFLAPDGLWQRWLRDAAPGGRIGHLDGYLRLIRGLCAFAGECAQPRPPR